MDRFFDVVVGLDYQVEMDSEKGDVWKRARQINRLGGTSQRSFRFRFDGVGERIFF